MRFAAGQRGQGQRRAAGPVRAALAGAALSLAACDFADDALVLSLTKDSPDGGRDAIAVPAAGKNPAPALSGGRPLVVIRFDRPGVSYREPLVMAVNAALVRNPGAGADVVAVVPRQDTPERMALVADRAQRNAKQVFRTLIESGLPGDRLSLRSISGSGRDEVHVYVR